MQIIKDKKNDNDREYHLSKEDDYLVIDVCDECGDLIESLSIRDEVFEQIINYYNKSKI